MQKFILTAMMIAGSTLGAQARASNVNGADLFVKCERNTWSHRGIDDGAFITLEHYNAFPKGSVKWPEGNVSYTPVEFSFRQEEEGHAPGPADRMVVLKPFLSQFALLSVDVNLGTQSYTKKLNWADWSHQYLRFSSTWESAPDNGEYVPERFGPQSLQCEIEPVPGYVNKCQQAVFPVLQTEAKSKGFDLKLQDVWPTSVDNETHPLPEFKIVHFEAELTNASGEKTLLRAKAKPTSTGPCQIVQ